MKSRLCLTSSYDFHYCYLLQLRQKQQIAFNWNPLVMGLILAGELSVLLKATILFKARLTSTNSIRNKASI